MTKSCFIQVKSLSDLESALVRNLTDHFGNNLMHIICIHDHDSLLPWITNKFGPGLLSEALADENRKGQNPISASIKVRTNFCKIAYQCVVRLLVTNDCFSVAAWKVQKYTMASDSHSAPREVSQQGWRAIASSHCIKIWEGKLAIDTSEITPN